MPAVEPLNPRPLVIGRYLLDRRIDAGELGSLWWADDQETGRRCVVCLVDVPQRRPGDPIPCTSREALAFAQVECGKLFRMQEHGEWQGMPFFVLATAEEEQEQASRPQQPRHTSWRDELPDDADPVLIISDDGDVRATLPSFSVAVPALSTDPKRTLPRAIEHLVTPVPLWEELPPSTCRPVAGGVELPSHLPAAPAAPVQAALLVPKRRSSLGVALVSLLVLAATLLVVLRLRPPPTAAKPSPAAAPVLIRPAAAAEPPLVAASSRPSPTEEVSLAAQQPSGATTRTGDPPSEAVRAPAVVEQPRARGRRRARPSASKATPKTTAPARADNVPDYGI